MSNMNMPDRNCPKCDKPMRKYFMLGHYECQNIECNETLREMDKKFAEAWEESVKKIKEGI